MFIFTNVYFLKLYFICVLCYGIDYGLKLKIILLFTIFVIVFNLDLRYYIVYEIRLFKNYIIIILIFIIIYRFHTDYYFNKKWHNIKVNFIVVFKNIYFHYRYFTDNFFPAYTDILKILSVLFQYCLFKK